MRHLGKQGTVLESRGINVHPRFAHYWKSHAARLYKRGAWPYLGYPYRWNPYKGCFYDSTHYIPSRWDYDDQELIAAGFGVPPQ